MVKVERYTGKTYMAPTGRLYTPEVMQEEFPAVDMFTHIVITDLAGEVLLGIDSLASIRSKYELDENLTEDEAIAAIEEIRNAPPEEPAPTAEERIAAIMEFEAMLKL